MRSDYVVGRYRSALLCVVEKIEGISKENPMFGRLLSLPLGLMISLSLPLVRIGHFLEILGTSLFNLLGAGWLGDCSLRDGMRLLLKTPREALGVLISPFSALFVGIALIASMLVDPYRASSRFAITCKSHERTCS